MHFFYKSELRYTFSLVIAVNSIFRMIKIFSIHQNPWEKIAVLKKHSQEDIYFQNLEFVCMITAITNLEFLI